MHETSIWALHSHNRRKNSRTSQRAKIIEGTGTELGWNPWQNNIRVTRVAFKRTIVSRNEELVLIFKDAQSRHRS